MKRIVFRPDRPVDREGDLFRALVAKLEFENWVIDEEPQDGDLIAYVGRERASAEHGARVKTGPLSDGVYVLPSTAPELRGRFFEGVWRNFAAVVLGRDLAVRDEYKGLAPEEIKARLDAKRFPFALLAANVAYDINIGSIIRSANAFLANEVVIYGRKKADLRGAMGAQNYENLVCLADSGELEEFLEKRRYQLICFEETDGAVDLARFEWPENPLLAFGQEGPGLPAELLARADARVVIPLHGSMRSINVGVAAGIAMYDWHAKRSAQL
ncbi:MAG: TrmH family RNA methyltransferase [Planctomycetota bacterium]|jgi:tRNA(Leu) C34 or U34 (ribose-2'-O)-methylase TrmL